MLNRIYLDYAAATPILPEVWAVFETASKELWANPNGIHFEAQKASASIEQARVDIAKILNCKAKELIFTASATESNNLAIQGLVNNQNLKTDSIPHFLISPIEHPSVLNTVEILQQQRSVGFDFLKMDKDGLIDLIELEKQILPETILISIIWVNNEIGTIQPIREIATKLECINQIRLSQNLPKVLLHIDASQAFLYQKIDLKDLGVDLMTLSGHKIYAPRGASLLFIQNDIKISSIYGGGGQERGLRSGTQNTACILAMAKAMQIAEADRDLARQEISRLQLYTFQKLIEKNENKNSNLFNKVIINGVEGNFRVVNNINFSLKNIDHQTLHTALDLAGFAISGGSSCSSGSLEVSSVIQAIRKASGNVLPNSEATLRLSLGKYNNKDDLDKFFDSLEQILGHLSY